MGPKDSQSGTQQSSCRHTREPACALACNRESPRTRASRVLKIPCPIQQPRCPLGRGACASAIAPTTLPSRPHHFVAVAVVGDVFGAGLCWVDISCQTLWTESLTLRLHSRRRSYLPPSGPKWQRRVAQRGVLAVLAAIDGHHNLQRYELIGVLPGGISSSSIVRPALFQISDSNKGCHDIALCPPHGYKHQSRRGERDMVQQRGWEQRQKLQAVKL